MSDLDATTPRVFLVRHGETEWTKAGRYTGSTDLELTPGGVNQITTTARHLVGPDKMVDPRHIVRYWVSPLKRAQQTFELLFSEPNALVPNGNNALPLQGMEGKVALTEAIAEWDYGDYEGLLAEDIRAKRRENGLDNEEAWNIWRDGCEGGESPKQVSDRLDTLIAKIRDLQVPYMNREQRADSDVVLVAHGLILRAFIKRWLGYPLDHQLPMIFSPGAIGTLSYKNHSVDEPCLCFGVAIPPTK